MKNQINGVGLKKQKIIIISFLYLGALIIIFLGVFFGAFSIMNDINIQVLNRSIPGIVFGLLVAYLGIRYYFMVTNFKTEFYKSTVKFSWSNFKKTKRN